MFRIAVGVIGISPSDFYSSEPWEMRVAIEGFNANKKSDFYLSQLAMSNAIGIFFGGNKFKEIDPFKQSKPVEEITLEGKQDTFDFLNAKFANKDGEKKQ